MARLVRHTATGPIRIDPENFPKDKPLFICACGLSQTLPLCDGSHKGCRAETDGVLYVYDTERRTVTETRPDEG
jgi:CDGSH-type Zn-finger protein